eukprot:SAG25_NODE_12610_length_277_cov_1.095506_1_plen_62_part_10
MYRTVPSRYYRLPVLRTGTTAAVWYDCADTVATVRTIAAFCLHAVGGILARDHRKEVNWLIS